MPRSISISAPELLSGRVLAQVRELQVAWQEWVRQRAAFVRTKSNPGY
jgi:hypothetical protein